jgi:hypothetical protein
MMERPENATADKPVSAEEFREAGREQREKREREAEERRKKGDRALAKKRYLAAGGKEEDFDRDYERIRREAAIQQAAGSEDAARAGQSRMTRSNF